MNCIYDNLPLTSSEQLRFAPFNYLDAEDEEDLEFLRDQEEELRYQRHREED